MVVANVLIEDALQLLLVDGDNTVEDDAKSSEKRVVGTTAKSIAMDWCKWLRTKVRQLWDGGRGALPRYFDTVDSETSMPSISSSP